MKMIDHARNASETGTRQGAVMLLCVFLLAGSAPAQTPCIVPDCPGQVAQLMCPPPGSTLISNEADFVWCNSGGDYFLDMETVPGAHDVFFAIVSGQSHVDLNTLPTNGKTIFVALWTQIHGQWQTPLNYTYTASQPHLEAPQFGSNGHFQFTIRPVTPGRTNVVQSSADLITWTPLSTNIATDIQFPIDDASVTNAPQQFYRAREIQ